MSKPMFRHFLRAFPCYRAMFRFFDSVGSEKERPVLYDIYCHYLVKARECFDSGLDFQPYEVMFSHAIDALNIPHFFDGV